jgi:hypothetical protein
MVDFLDPALVNKLVLLAIVLVLLWIAVKVGQAVVRLVVYLLAAAVAFGAVYYIFLR